MEIDDRQASQIHGIISSDSDSDYNSREFDEEYYSLKPPPLEYESIKDKIVIISRKQIVNAWKERLENSQKNNEEKTKSIGNVTLVTKTKKKKKSKSKTVSNVENSGIAAVSSDKVHNEFSELKECVEDEIHNKPGTSAAVSNEDSGYVILPDLPKKVAQKKLKDNAQKQVFNSLSNESLGSFVSTKKKEATKINSPKIFYDSDTLKKVGEKLSELKNVWHSGLSDKIVQQEQNLQRQKESEMYEFWMKSARMEVKPEESIKKEGKTVKKKGKTKNESEALVVETQGTNLPKSITKIKKEAAKKEKTQINSNSKKNYMQELNLQCQKETEGTNLPKSIKKIEKEAAEKEKMQINSSSKKNVTQELNLQCQKEIDMYDFWMKLAGVKVKQKKTVKKEDKTVKNNEETEKKPKKLLVESQVTNVLVHNREVEKGSTENEKMKVSNNSRENDAQNSNSRLLEKESMEQVWHLDNFVNNQITAASYGIESPTRINYETEKANTIIKAKKKTKRKKKTKQADDISVNQSLINEAGNDEVISLENVTNKAEGNSLVHTGPKETIEMSHNEEKYNPELLDIDLVERIWFLPDNVNNKIQYITEIQAAAVGEIKTKRKRKKKSKQLIVESESVNQPENVKDIKFPKKEEAQIIENFKETSMEISNSRLLDTETTGSLWHFNNIVDNQIQWFATLSNGIESDPRNNNEIEEISTTTKTKKKTRGKKKSKQTIDISSNLNLKNEAGNDEVSSVENVTNQAKDNSLVQTDSKETKVMYHNEEKYNPQLLDVDLMERIWFLPDNVHNKIQYITEIQAATIEEIKTKRKRKKKKKSNQLTVGPPPEINPHNKVGQDVEKTNEDRIRMEEQQTDNSTVILEKQQIVQEYMVANTKKNKIISHEDIPINNDLETTLNHPTTLENPDFVFGEEFKYFIQNIDCEDTSIVPNLSAFKYEQLQRAYMAYQEKSNVAKSGNVVNKVATKNHTSERYIVRHSIENPNTMLNVYFMSTSIPNYSNGNCITYLDETNTVNGMAKVSEECQIKERNLDAVNRITENSIPAVLEDTSNVINIHSSPKFSEETVSTRFNSEGETNINISLNNFSQIEKKYSISDSTADLKTNSATTRLCDNTFTTSKDFDESFGIFSRTYNDAIGFDIISTHNVDKYKQLYRIMYEGRKKNSSAGNEIKKTKNTVQDVNGLWYHLDTSNDDFKYNSHITPTCSTSTSGQRNMKNDYGVFEQGTRNVPTFPWRSENYCSRSSKQAENRNNSNVTIGNEMPYYDGPIRKIQARDHMGNTENVRDSLIFVLFHVFLIWAVAFVITNVIKSVVSFLYDNIFLVAFVIFMCMKFKS